MTKGQILDRLSSMGYYVVMDEREIIVKKDQQHIRSFYNWNDIRRYFNMDEVTPINNELLYVSNSVFNSLLNDFIQSNDIFASDEKTIENIADKSVKISKILIEKCK